jgi:hypothetical protein
MSFPSTISSGSHSYILWKILTCTKKLFARLQVYNFDKGHVVISIVMNLQIEVCKSKSKWYQSKDKLIEWHLVDTENWYRKETDLWAEFGKRTPFGKEFSSKHSVKTPAVGSTPSFGRRAVSRLEERTFGNTWWRGLNVKKERIDDRCKTGHWCRGINLGSKCCNRGWLGVVLGQGYNMNP